MAPLGGIGRQLLQWLRPPTESVDGGAHSDAVDPRAFDDETSDEELDPEEAARDARIRARMVAHGITPIRRFIASYREADVVLRPRAEIIERLCGLTLAATKAGCIARAEGVAGLEPLIAAQYARHGRRWLFAGQEEGFIRNPDPPADEARNFAWRLESATVMLWALNLVDTLPEADEASRSERLLECVKGCSDLPDRGRRSARELLDEEDLAFRCHTIAGMAYFRGLPVPQGLDLDVLEERKTALEWLTRDVPWRDPPHQYDRNEEGRLVMLEGGAVRSEWVVFPAQTGLKGERDEEPREEDEGTLEQIVRKRNSERLLRGLGLPVYPWQPMVLGEEDALPWDWATVLGRMVGLGIVAIKAANLLGGSPPALVFNEIRDKVDRYDLDPVLSPKERAFINDPAPSASDITQFAWRAESCWLLMWALGRVDEPLGPPYTQLDWDRFREIFWSCVEETMFRPRSLAELLDEYDLTFRCYWPAQYFYENDIPQPGGFDRNVLIERYHSLQWLLMRFDWDDWNDDALPEPAGSATLQ